MRNSLIPEGSGSQAAQFNDANYLDVSSNIEEMLIFHGVELMKLVRRYHYDDFILLLGGKRTQGWHALDLE